jgi:hypothetical protein
MSKRPTWLLLLLLRSSYALMISWLAALQPFSRSLAALLLLLRAT